MKESNNIIRTTMSLALIRGLDKANEEGVNTKRVGRNIVTAVASGVGVKFKPRKKHLITNAA